jgi:hypothetical protein
VLGTLDMLPLACISYYGCVQKSLNAAELKDNNREDC